MEWQHGIGELRIRTAAQVPELVRRRKIPPVQRAVVTGWHLGKALLGWKFIDLRRNPDTARAGLSRRLRVAFSKLGPTYIKLGQILSSGEGIFPEELVKEFILLRDRVPAESFETVRKVLEAELNKPLEAVFDDFSTTPLAAASIAQVHTARLKTGEEVVVKVQRPTVSDLVKKDLAAMAWISPRSPTRRRWSTCSPRPSPKNSTSVSKHRTCSTWRACSPPPTSARWSCPARIRSSSRSGCW
jgi:ubiquinone biosynthesis protein